MLGKENNVIEILQQNMNLLQNDLPFKNEIIKPLMEMQSSVLYKCQKILLPLKFTTTINVNHSRARLVFWMRCRENLSFRNLVLGE